MGKYIINEIIVDGYERYAVVQNSEQEELCVHFGKYDEYLDDSEESCKKKKGDMLEGDLSITLICASQKADEEFSYTQKIPGSSHIEAVVEVVKVVDKYSLNARSSIFPNYMLLEFETEVDYKVGDRIFVSGSLELNIV